jgi:two-component system, NarL family, sensor kinase
MNKAENIAERVDALSQMQNEIAQQLMANNRQMRNLARRVWRSQEQERKHIAAELHDGVGQLLSALINQLEHVSRQDKGVDLSVCLDLARVALSDTREVSRLMRPRILDDLGLLAALQWLVRIMSEKGKTLIQLDNEMERELDEETQTLIFRVVQEALTNAVKHANASYIQVLVAVKSQVLLIKVKDNGVGMVQTQAKAPDGFGLAAMEDRVEAFGGQLTIDSSPGAGCELKVLLTSIDKL